jgi:acyl-CoA synthetase (AMP-forming)/AMP-acid ligase II
VTYPFTWQTIPEMVLSAADRFGDAEAVVDHGDNPAGVDHGDNPAGVDHGDNPAGVDHGDNPAGADGPLRLTFVQLADRVRRAAGAFLAHGIERGDRVAIWAPNSAEWMIAAFGALTAGAVVVPVNTRFRTEEAADVIRRSGSKLVLRQQGFLGQEFQVPDAVPAIEIKSDFLVSGQPAEATGLRGTDVADIIYTSGTTGRPKGVMMNHLQTLRLYAEWCDLVDLRAGDRYLIVNPFFHTFGYKAGCIASLIRGATVLPVPVFDVDAVVDLIAAERITMLPGPPTLYHSLLAVPDKSKLATLRAGVTGAADIPVELIRRIHEELPFKTVATGYGLTEAGTATLSRPGDSFTDIATTVGTACDGVEVRIADDGEVLIRGYSVMQGYLDDPAATAEAIDADGWLHTGDLGTMDENKRLRIVGRKKDMFIVGGFNAYPAEIEGFILEHPDIAQVAVIGVDDERLGQVGKAFVVLKESAEGTRERCSVDDLIAWCRERMAGYKVPRYVEFLDELPLNATGKVMKDRLQARQTLSGC